MAATMIDDTDANLRDIISSLYVLIAQAHEYQGSGTEAAMRAEIKRLIKSLLHLSNTAKRLPVYLPVEIIQYVEAARNPDIYTREFVELVMRYNQQQKGRSEAFAQFRDILAQQMAVGIPELRPEVDRVVKASARAGN